MATLRAGSQRYVVALVVFVLVAFVYLMFSSYEMDSQNWSQVKQVAPQDQAPYQRTALENAIELNEFYYQRSLKERQDLIKKWGPTPAEVEAFPSDHQNLYTIWDFFIPAFNCPHRVERIGARGDGGKWVCGMDRIAKKKNCVVYSVGINGESSFEAAVLERGKNCEMYGYDFSVDSWGPEIENVSALKQRAHFQPWALGGEDKHGPQDSIKMYTLQTLMQMNRHTFIDILKIDIEGAEFSALKSLLDQYNDKPLPFGQLQLEIHLSGKPFHEVLEWWEMLESHGLRPFWTEPNMVYMNIVRGVQPDLAEYSFININGRHDLVADL